MEKTGFTEEDLTERIADINSHYLNKAIEKGDNAMIKHWNLILQKYEQNLSYLKSKK